MPSCAMRSMATRARAMATTGVPSKKMTLVAYMDQMNKGRRNQVRPGARMRWGVTTKLRPVRIDEKRLIKMPRITGTTLVCDDLLLNGVENVQPVSTPPASMARRVMVPPRVYGYQLSRV